MVLRAWRAASSVEDRWQRLMKIVMIWQISSTLRSLCRATRNTSSSLKYPFCCFCFYYSSASLLISPSRYLVQLCGSTNSQRQQRGCLWLMFSRYSCLSCSSERTVRARAGSASNYKLMLSAILRMCLFFTFSCRIHPPNTFTLTNFHTFSEVTFTPRRCPSNNCSTQNSIRTFTSDSPSKIPENS